MESPENILEIQKSERFKKGPGKPGKNQRFEENRENSSKEKDKTEPSRPPLTVLPSSLKDTWGYSSV